MLMCSRIACCALLVALCALVPAARAAPSATPLRRQMDWYAKEANWLPNASGLDRAALVASIEAARAYLLNHQQATGNFDYEYQVAGNRVRDTHDQVREAGALWALACLYRARPTEVTRRAVIRGLDFFFRVSGPLDCGQIAPIYPGDTEVKVGSVALVCLAIADFCRGEREHRPSAAIGLYQSWLTQYLAFLAYMELDNASWGQAYLVSEAKRQPLSNPYADGECLLAYSRAARYMDRKELVSSIEKRAPALARKYTVTAWQTELDSGETKGFFQWGCLAYAEYVGAGWREPELIADAALSLAWWQIHAHRVQLRRGNTAYAAEGLLAARDVADRTGNAAAAKRLGDVALSILSRLIPSQIAGRSKTETPTSKR